MTTFYTTIPVSHALWPVAAEFVGNEMTWRPQRGNFQQELIYTYKEESLRLANLLTRRELVAMAADNCDAINQFLKNLGFNISLDDQGNGLGYLYAASVMKLFGEWLFPGVKGYFLPLLGRPGFRLPATGLGFYEYKGRTVVEIPTSRRGMSVLVSEPSCVGGPSQAEDWLFTSLGKKKSKGNGIILPAITVTEINVDLSKLQGMKTEDSWRVVQALMAFKFALNQRHVSLEAAFAYSAAKGIVFEDPKLPEDGDYIADHPLNFALVMQGHALPLAVGLVGREHMDPMIY